MKHQVHNFCADFNVRGDSELCIYLLSRALVTFTCDLPHHLDIPLCNVTCGNGTKNTSIQRLRAVAKCFCPQSV